MVREGTGGVGEWHSLVPWPPPPPHPPPPAFGLHPAPRPAQLPFACYKGVKNETRMSSIPVYQTWDARGESRAEIWLAFISRGCQAAFYMSIDSVAPLFMKKVLFCYLFQLVIKVEIEL